MTDSSSGPDGGLLRALFRTEHRLYELSPIDARYSKLFVRTFLWFLFFWAVYLLVSPLL